MRSLVFLHLSISPSISPFIPRSIPPSFLPCSFFLQPLICAESPLPNIILSLLSPVLFLPSFPPSFLFLLLSLPVFSLPLISPSLSFSSRSSLSTPPSLLSLSFPLSPAHRFHSVKSWQVSECYILFSSEPASPCIMAASQITPYSLHSALLDQGP